MKKTGLTLEKLSEKSGVSVSLLSRYGNQTTSNPSLSSLISIARGLDVGIDELLKGVHLVKLDEKVFDSKSISTA